MMLERLCKLIEDNYKFLNLSVGYSKVTDWVIEVEERISVGQSNTICSFQSGDLDYCAAQAYIKTTDWLCEHHGGY